MITGIIFSKDRPAQLQACIESIHKNAPGIFDLNVLFTASDNSFQRGYNLLRSEKPQATMFKEQKPEYGFKESLMYILKEHTKQDELFCFFTDDSILYRKMEASYEEIENLFNIDQAMCLSLRLGENTYIQNPYKKTISETPKNCAWIHDRFMGWEWYLLPSSSNFGYPFSVDGHVYRKSDMIEILDSYGYDTPNSLEGRFPVGTQLFPLMCSFKESVLVNTPINIVGSSENQSGEFYGMSLKELNDKYIDGKRINIDKMDFSNIVGCHQEVELVLE